MEKYYGLTVVGISPDSPHNPWISNGDRIRELMVLALHSASQALEQPRVSSNISSPLFTAERLLPDQVQDANHWVAPKRNR